MILTDKGEFSGFNTLRFAYLLAYDGNPPIQQYFRQDGWDDATLHISELGKCPRKQMLRLSGAPRAVRSIDSLANDELMYWQGNIIHALTVGACDWAGILVSYEQSLPNLPDGWSGHYDLIWDDRERHCTPAWDGKTVRPNAFDYWYSWPKVEETAQMQGYLRFLPACEFGEVEHIDRGGSNPPQTSIIGRDDSWVINRMLWLEDLRNNLPELPDPLGWDYEVSYRKVNNEPLHLISNVWYKPNWQCGWCDYLHGFENKKTHEWRISPESPCKPDLRPKELIAKVLKGTLHFELPQHKPQVEAWLKDQLQEWYDPEPVVE